MNAPKTVPKVKRLNKAKKHCNMGIYPASFRDFCAKNDVENTKTNTANGAEAAAKQHVSTAIRFYQSIYGIATPRKVEFGKNPPEYEVDDIEIY